MHTYFYLYHNLLWDLSSIGYKVSVSWICEKKCIKDLAHVFRVQLIWRFQNVMLENPSIKDSWVNPTNWPKKTLKVESECGVTSKPIFHEKNGGGIKKYFWCHTPWDSGLFRSISRVNSGIPNIRIFQHTILESHIN